MNRIAHISTTNENRWAREAVSKSVCDRFDLELSGSVQQEIKGFGGCFNELGAIALSYLNEKDKGKILDELFCGEGSCNFNFCRLPVGANDYAAEWYSHDESDNDYDMEHFSISRDHKYLLPYIREGIRRNGDIMLFASPWSPPTWMKFPKAYNYGTIRWEERVLNAYALYLLKFVKAYEAEGIKINQLHVQNEPIADQKFPSCVWAGSQLRDFIRDYAGPLFRKECSETEIWLGTLNCPYENYGDSQWQKTNFQNYAFTVLLDDEARKYVDGVGYQWGGKNAIAQTRESFPELRLMQTESECGDGKNSWGYMEYVFDLMKHYFNNGIESYIYWNMVLLEGGESTWGWRQNSLISIDKQAKTYTLNPEFYLMKHFSSFIGRGARYIGLKGRWAANSLAFRNPDGKVILVIKNAFDHEAELNANAGAAFSARLRPHSVNTFEICQE